MFTKAARFYDAIYSFKNYGAEAEHLREIIDRNKLSRGKNLLDVACGTGAHLAHLSRHYTAEGLDLDPQMIAIARERLPALRFHHADMIDFSLGRSLDVVVCLFSAIGYVKTPARMREAVANM